MDLKLFEKGLAAGDNKPKNILLTRDGEVLSIDLAAYVEVTDREGREIPFDPQDNNIPEFTYGYLGTFDLLRMMGDLGEGRITRRNYFGLIGVLENVRTFYQWAAGAGAVRDAQGKIIRFEMDESRLLKELGLDAQDPDDPARAEKLELAERFLDVLDDIRKLERYNAEEVIDWARERESGTYSSDAPYAEKGLYARDIMFSLLTRLDALVEIAAEAEGLQEVVHPKIDLSLEEAVEALEAASKTVRPEDGKLLTEEEALQATGVAMETETKKVKKTAAMPSAEEKVAEMALGETYIYTDGKEIAEDVDAALNQLAPAGLVERSESRRLESVPQRVVTMGVEEFADFAMARLERRLEVLNSEGRALITEMLAVIRDLRGGHRIAYALPGSGEGNEDFLNVITRVPDLNIALYSQDGRVDPEMAGRLRESDIPFQMFRLISQMTRSLNLTVREESAVGFVVPASFNDDPSLDVRFDLENNKVVVPITVLQDRADEDPLVDAAVMTLQAVVAIVLAREAEAQGREALLNKKTLSDMIESYNLFSGMRERPAGIAGEELDRQYEEVREQILNSLLAPEGNQIRISTRVLKAYISFMAEQRMRQSA